jgi:hypothetical protein
MQPAPRRAAAAAALLLGGGVLAATAAPAGAHQTAYGNGVAVTMHVAPDDAPVAGVPATVNVVRVAPPRGGRWSFRTGRPTLRITDSSGKVVRTGRAKRHQKVTFKRAGAYQLVFSGRYKKAGRYRSFTTRFAIRAS